MFDRLASAGVWIPASALAIGLVVAGAYLAVAGRAESEPAPYAGPPLRAATSPSGNAAILDDAQQQNAAARSDGRAQEIVVDGSVTEAEYREAAEAEVACLREIGAGFARGPEFGRRGRMQYLVAVDHAAPGAPSPGAVRACFDQWAIVSEIWNLSHPPSATDFAEARAWLRTCVADNGVADLPEVLQEGWVDYRALEHPPEQLSPEQKALATAISRCVPEMQWQFNLPGFGG